MHGGDITHGETSHMGRHHALEETSNTWGERISTYFGTALDTGFPKLDSVIWLSSHLTFPE